MSHSAQHIYLTGLSGTGKSSIISNLQNRGYYAIDTDYDDWKIFSACDRDWLLNEQKVAEILKSTTGKPLIISGCCANQATFYKFFDCVVLLSASIETILDRVAGRQSNSYGQTIEERNEIVWNFENIQPLLKKGADIEYDTDKLNIEEITVNLIHLLLK